MKIGNGRTYQVVGGKQTHVIVRVKSLSIDAFRANPRKIRSREAIVEWDRKQGLS